MNAATGPIPSSPDLADDPVFARAKARPGVRAFDYQNVSLLPGPLRDQVDHARRVYGGVANDDILKGFRRGAGLAAPGSDMGGWCAQDSAMVFGQFLSGMARMGAAAKDAALLAKARHLLAGWAETLSPDGDPRMGIYEWEKLVCGLVDMHHYADDASALPLLARTTAWAEANWDRSRPPSDLYDFWGGGPGRTPEWYTLPENLYRAYLLSGDLRFKNFAEVWLYEDYWAPFETTAAPAQAVVPAHAYSHVNSFSSAAMAHAVTGDPRYLRICVNAYDFLQATQCYATGGYGPDERLMPADGSLGRSLELYAGHAEIPCGSWAAFKLSSYLIRFTGQARFGDWIETLLYNGIGAALPIEPDGRAYYYGDYRISGGTKQHYWHQWPCCSGSYLQTLAAYHDVIYFQDDAGLYVNLFVPSELRWSHKSGEALIRQETNYPEAESSTLRFELSGPMRLPLRIRIPAWCEGASFVLNSAPLEVDAKPGRWAVIEREWLTGDALTILLPMSLRLSAIDAQHPNRAAVLFGPQVLAQDEACCRRPFALPDHEALSARLVRSGPDLSFRILNTAPERHTRHLRPLRSFPAHWPHWVYFDLEAPPLY